MQEKAHQRSDVGFVGLNFDRIDPERREQAVARRPCLLSAVAKPFPDRGTQDIKLDGSLVIKEKGE